VVQVTTEAEHEIPDAGEPDTSSTASAPSSVKRLIVGVIITGVAALFASSLGILSVSDVRAVGLWIGMAGVGYLAMKQVHASRVPETESRTGEFISRAEAEQTVEEYAEEKYQSPNADPYFQRSGDQLSFDWGEAQTNWLAIPPTNPSEAFFSFITKYGKNNSPVHIWVDAKRGEVSDYVVLRHSETEQDHRENPFKHCPQVKEYRRGYTMKAKAVANSGRRRQMDDDDDDEDDEMDGMAFN